MCTLSRCKGEEICCRAHTHVQMQFRFEQPRRRWNASVCVYWRRFERLLAHFWGALSLFAPMGRWGADPSNPPVNPRAPHAILVENVWRHCWWNIPKCVRASCPDRCAQSALNVRGALKDNIVGPYNFYSSSCPVCFMLMVSTIRDFGPEIFALFLNYAHLLNGNLIAIFCYFIDLFA